LFPFRLQVEEELVRGVPFSSMLVALNVPLISKLYCGDRVPIPTFPEGGNKFWALVFRHIRRNKAKWKIDFFMFKQMKCSTV
jgi:hypothetical protein